MSLILAATLAAGLASAPAGDAAVQAFIGATLTIDNLEGWHADRILAADHSYRQTGSDGPVTGVWSVEGGKLCTMQKSPPPPDDRAPRYCNLGPGHKLGDSWQDYDPVTGAVVYFSLKPAS